jgi:predicted dehydrogenase
MTTSSPAWGILGTGGIAAAMTRDLQLDGHTVAAVGSRTPEAAARFAAAHAIPRSHGSYEELAADPDVDVVYIATPHPQHAPNALQALAAGKHVLVEKPFTMDQREAQQIADAARAGGLVALEAMWTRWLPHMERLQEVLSDGTLGEVRSVVAHHNQRTNPDPAARMLNPVLGGGALLDLGIYPVSFAWDVLGAPGCSPSPRRPRPVWTGRRRSCSATRREPRPRSPPNSTRPATTARPSSAPTPASSSPPPSTRRRASASSTRPAASSRPTSRASTGAGCSTRRARSND